MKRRCWTCSSRSNIQFINGILSGGGNIFTVIDVKVSGVDLGLLEGIRATGMLEFTVTGVSTVEGKIAYNVSTRKGVVDQSE